MANSGRRLLIFGLALGLAGFTAFGLTALAAKDAGTLQDEAATALSKGNFDAAVKSYQKAVKEDPGNAYSRVGLCSALQGAGQWQAALSEANQLIKLHPDFAPVYYNLGEIYEHLGSAEQAKSAYQSYIQKTGTNNLPPSPELRIKFRKLGLL